MPDPKKMPVLGEWYWGAKCTRCDEMVPVNNDPMRGQGNIRIVGQTPGGAKFQAACPNGHPNVILAESMVRFEWGKQPRH